MDVVVDDWRLTDARRSNRLVEQRMALKSDERAGDHDRREGVFALLTWTALTVRAGAERRRIELHTITLRGVVLRKPLQPARTVGELFDCGRRREVVDGA